MQRIRVLIADDHPVYREGLTKLLQQEEDMEVVAQAGNGEEAVRLASEVHVDVAIIDVAMPGLNGIEATKQIKTACPTIAILMLSAFGYEAYLLGAIEAGAAGYLSKNVRALELITCVRAVYAGETVLDPAAARKIFQLAAQSRGSPRAREDLRQLHPRQLEVLRLAAKGMSNEEISQELAISRRTVQTHLTSIFTKLNVGSRTEAVVRALKETWLSLDDIS